MAEGDDLLTRYQDALAALHKTDALPERLEVYRVEAEMAKLAVRLRPTALLELIRQKYQIEARHGVRCST
jgi:hypothetical protein